MTKRRRRWGDRSDGRRLRSLNPYETVSPYIMVERNDAQNLFCDKFDASEVENYIRKKRNAGMKKFGIMHVIIAAYVRAISQKPGINRFLSGQKVFARNDIQINMAVKRALSPDETNTVIKVFLEPTDTADDVYRKFNETYDAAFAEGENNFDGTARLINYIPGLLKKHAVWWLKLLDYFGHLPKSLLRVSPFHGSMFITSMGSLGIPPIYHHLYNFGNVPVFIAFGAKRHENVLTDNGSVIKKCYIDYNIVTDERICDGFYFASALKCFRRMLKTPQLLDEPPETVVEDID